MRESRTGFGAIVAVLAGILAVLKLPRDVADIEATWRSLEIQMPPEVVRLALIAALGIIAAVALAPGISSAARFACQRWQAARQSRAEAEERRRGQAAARQRLEGDIRDYLIGAQGEDEFLPVLRKLAVGPQALHFGAGELLRQARIAEPVGLVSTAFPGAGSVYRLTEIARPIVEKFLENKKEGRPG